MRARELLLEYRRDETVKRFGPKLLAAFRADASDYARQCMANLEHHMRNAADGWTTKARQTHIINWMMEEIEDCIEQQKLIPWVVRCYASGGFLWEDLTKAGNFTNEYARLRQNGYFKRNPEANTQFGDINRFKTLSDLGEFLLAVRGDTMSNSAKERDFEANLLSNGEAQVLFDDADWKIVVPKTKAAAIHFGRNTQWCTAATESANQFDWYAERGDLFIILNKKANRRWQLHIQSEQFMDENDRMANFSDIAPLIRRGAFNGVLNNQTSRGAFLVLSARGFPTEAIVPIVQSMAVDARGVLAVATYDYQRRRSSPSSFPTDEASIEVIDTALKNAPFSYTTQGKEVIKHIMPSMSEVILYAFQKNEMKLLWESDWASFNYTDCAHYMEALDFLTHCCVLEHKGRRVYFGSLEGVAQIATNIEEMGPYPSLYELHDVVEKNELPQHRALFKAVIEIGEKAREEG